MATWGHKVIDLEEGWDVMQRGITKVINIIEGMPEQRFSSEEYMMFYGTICNMSGQAPPFGYRMELYVKYRETIEEYIISTVLPSLREKRDEIMLSELVKRWSNHGAMVKWLSRFFDYLDRNLIRSQQFLLLAQVANTCFRDLVYQEFNAKARDAVISLIDKEREGDRIDRDLLKNLVNIFVEIGMGVMYYYRNDFEEALFKDTASYYSQKASTWILEEDYMSKVEECLKREKDRVAHYLHSSSEIKLLEIVKHELLSICGAQMREEGASSPRWPCVAQGW